MKTKSGSFTLIIVESFSKCAKIEEYLGPGYKCIASMGHIRSLNHIKDIDIPNNFTPTYSIIEDSNKQTHLEYMRTTIENASEVILATDNDREGEAISFHICEVFDLPIETTKRILFNEITESAIKHAIQNPVTINISIVKAQQTRQILDVLVGFTITPVLWKYISKNNDKGLSAGRCQTPALRLIYENYLANKAMESQKVYTVTGYFTNLNLPFTLNKQLDSTVPCDWFLEESVNFSHIYLCGLPKQITKSPPSPFSTSILQQTASNELHFSPKETMTYCQELYENGYITYMRTDSIMYSKEFIQEINKYILNNYSDKHIQTKSNLTKENVEKAHEAIRPTSIFVKTIESKKISARAIRLYHLIWRNTLESCMTPAIYNEITAEITAVNEYKYQYTANQVVFAGWKMVSLEAKESNTKTTDPYSYLLSIKSNTQTEYKKITAIETHKKLPNHYTEAYLVQLLEKHGIGRPSTFASLIDKIQERQYVKKMNIDGKTVSCTDYVLEGDELTIQPINRTFGNEKNKLVIQPLGIMVIELLIKHFDTLFEYTYTQEMENQLDLIVTNEMNGIDLCNRCYTEMFTLSGSLLNESRQIIKIDDKHTYMIAKHGPVIKCIEDGKTTFKNVKENIDLDKLSKGEYLLEEIIQSKNYHILGRYQSEDLIVRKGKYGIYVTWGNNSKNMSHFGNRPLENITFAEVFEILEKDGVMDPAKSVGYLREISKTLSLRRGKFGDYIFYKTSKMKNPKFLKLDGIKLDYRNCDKELVKAWIKEKHGVE